MSIFSIFSVFSDAEPLHLAVERHKTSRVRRLLDEGMPVDSRTSEKVTPLMVAAKRGFDDIVELLIGAGADVNAQDLPIRGDEGRFSALMLAAEAGHDTTCRLLLEAGADPNSYSQWGNTALNFACDQNRLKVVETLYDLGRFPTAQGRRVQIRL